VPGVALIVDILRPLSTLPHLGWRDEGTVGIRGECLAHIAVVWTDMRPTSMRRALNG